MREIIFRGQVKYNGGHYFSGDWVYGDLLRDSHGDWFIIDKTEDECSNVTYNKVLVIPETVGQYTGRTDKQNYYSKIYEGDKVERIGRVISGLTGVVVFKRGAFVVEYFDECYEDSPLRGDASYQDGPAHVKDTWAHKVIGNIHE